jgi:hypothetical protein
MGGLKAGGISAGWLAQPGPRGALDGGAARAQESTSQSRTTVWHNWQLAQSPGTNESEPSAIPGSAAWQGCATCAAPERMEAASSPPTTAAAAAAWLPWLASMPMAMASADSALKHTSATKNSLNKRRMTHTSGGMKSKFPNGDRCYISGQLPKARPDISWPQLTHQCSQALERWRSTNLSCKRLFLRFFASMPANNKHIALLFS